MILINLLLFLLFLFVLIKSADYAVHYSSGLARIFHISEFIVSFFVVTLISVAPETTVSIISAIKGMPEFGMGVLLGSNVADLTLVFGVIALVSARGITVRSEIIKNDLFYLALLLFPLLLGLDGYYSRIDGILLFATGAFFFFTLSLQSKMFRKKLDRKKTGSFLKNFILLALSMIFLLISANFALDFGINLAEDMNIPAVLIGLIFVGAGCCLPELLFSIRAVRKKHNGLALGDILGTVITDATIILGLIVIINPFYFRISLILLTGMAMFIAGLLAIFFITSGKILTKREGIYLLIFYIIYLIAEVVVNKFF